MISVILDPGHPTTSGDRGCIAQGIEEYEYTYGFCEMFKHHFDKFGYPVILNTTRSTKVQVISHQDRAAKARLAKADIAISVHVNSYVNESLKGAHAFVLSGDQLAADLGDLWLRCCPVPHYTKGRKAIIIDPDRMQHTYERRIYNVLRHYDPIPSILLELAFASHRADRAALLSASTQQGMFAALMALIARLREKKENACYPGFNG